MREHVLTELENKMCMLINLADKNLDEARGKYIEAEKDVAKFPKLMRDKFEESLIKLHEAKGRHKAAVIICGELMEIIKGAKGK